LVRAPLSHQTPAVVEPAPSISPETPVVPNRLLSRLPSHVRGQIIALEMEDHYVRVHTDRGSALVLLRLSDAMAEVAAIAGRQVHRSWWVAADAIEHFERVGRAGQIRLRNGLIAPVSQRYLKDLDSHLK
jgi:DNA-binding LytR/AlgR family response regulator